MNLFIKSIKSLIEFFFQQKEYKNFVFYSESINYRNYFENTIEGLVKDYNLKVTYLSSDVEDVIKLSNVKNLYIGKGIIRTIFFQL